MPSSCSAVEANERNRINTHASRLRGLRLRFSRRIPKSVCELFQTLVLFPGVNKNRQIGIGIFPQGKELFIGLAASRSVAGEREGASLPKMRERNQRCRLKPTRMFVNHPKLCCRFCPFTAKIDQFDVGESNLTEATSTCRYNCVSKANKAWERSCRILVVRDRRHRSRCQVQSRELGTARPAFSSSQLCVKVRT